LFAFAGTACERMDFLHACNDSDFERHVAASLPLPVTKKWSNMVLNATQSVPNTQGSPIKEPIQP
jgi:hypothetical protein